MPGKTHFNPSEVPANERIRVDPTLEKGLNLAHPKVFVGFFKHANYVNKDTHLKTTDSLAKSAEYRSDDWYYFPVENDLHPGNEIGDWNAPNGVWNYGKAYSTPFNINGGFNKATDICSFGDKE